MKKLLTIFPGVGYGLDSPLLYYADFVYEAKGFDRIHMNYQNIFANKDLSLEEKLQKVREYVLEQVKDTNFDSYDEVVFLSKSVGSVEAGILAKRLNTATSTKRTFEREAIKPTTYKRTAKSRPQTTKFQANPCQRPVASQVMMVAVYTGNLFPMPTPSFARPHLESFCIDFVSESG